MNANDRTVTVQMPTWVWGRLATIASFRGVTTGDLVAEGISLILDRDGDRIRELKAELSTERSRKIRRTLAAKRGAQHV